MTPFIFVSLLNKNNTSEPRIGNRLLNHNGPSREVTVTHIAGQLAATGRRWRIGYLSELPFCPATPGVRRVLTQTVQALKTAGHELVPFQLDCGPDELQLFLEAAVPDNGHFLLKAV